MSTLAVPRSWAWRARLRVGARLAMTAWGPVPLVLLGSSSAGAVAAASGIGVVILVLLVAVRGPSSTEVAVAGALRTGEPPAGLSLAVVDTEAAARLRRGRWARFALAGGLAVVVVGVVLVVLAGATAGRMAYWSAVSATTLLSSWAVTTSAREAVRWRAGAAERWAAWSAAARARGA